MDKFVVTATCWEWSAATNKAGYGEFLSRRWPGQSRLAHRIMYELFIGPVPEGLDLDHLCRNRCCVRPSHLEPVTRQTNLLRGNTITARNATATHCIRGHEFSETNTYINPAGARRCRKCRAEEQLRRYHRQKAA